MLNEVLGARAFSFAQRRISPDFASSLPLLRKHAYALKNRGRCPWSPPNTNVAPLFARFPCLVLQKPLMFRIKVMYAWNGQQVDEQTQVSAFPAGY